MEEEMKARSGFMSEVEFWYILQCAKKSTHNDEALASYVIETLSKRNIESILGFDYWFSKFFYNSYTADLWCAAFIAKGGCDDDDFDYFRAWMIGQGEQVYTSAVTDPDSLVDVFEQVNIEGTTNEPLLIAASKAYEEKTGGGQGAFYKLLDEYETDFGSFRKLKFAWNPEIPESMQKVCPKIYEKFWWRMV